MTTHATKLRSPLLSSRAIRDALSHRTEAPFTASVGVVDQLGNLFDALSAARDHQDPTVPAEGQAKAFKTQYDSATARATQLLEANARQLGAFEAAAWDGAFRAVYLTSEVPGAAEVRSALRQMSQNDRDEALRTAFETADRVVINAVHFAPTPLLIGPTTLPVKEMVRQYVQAQTPSLAQDLADVETAANHVGLASDAFRRAAAALRDIGAEDRAAEGQKAAQAASQALAAALQGKTAPAA